MNNTKQTDDPTLAFHIETLLAFIDRVGGFMFPEDQMAIRAARLALASHHGAASASHEQPVTRCPCRECAGKEDR